LGGRFEISRGRSQGNEIPDQLADSVAGQNILVDLRVSELLDTAAKLFDRAFRNPAAMVEEGAQLAQTLQQIASGSQRRYSKATFYKIISITLAQSAGFNLDEIAEQLRNLPDIHRLPPKVWGPLHKLWERRIDQRVAELKQLKINLRRCTRDASR
jgi:DNA-binding transcriptional MerR regulator